MPELPDITLYLEALQKRVAGASLNQFRIANPFLLRTAVPPLSALIGKRVTSFARIGKRIALGFEPDLWLVFHLMIAGRLHWAEAANSPTDLTQYAVSEPVRAKTKRKSLPGRHGAIASFEFTTGSLTFTEAGTRKRASLHLLQGETALRAIDPLGLEVLDCTLADFSRVLTSSNHTLKRALTDPHLFSGIGNSYSDEILHQAQLSPVALTQKLAKRQIEKLYQATQETLTRWIRLLRLQTGDSFPENVTAFRPEMAVHGKFSRPCPVCQTTIQRIRYADNETNYCPRCQTGGKLLADRSLSLLLKKDWPRTPEELEELRSGKA